jgi:hypothetical protein
LKRFRAPAPPKDGLAAALRALWQRWKIPRPAYLIVGSKGVWTGEERRALKKRLLSLAGKVAVMSDVELAFESAFTPAGGTPGRAPGLLILAGTGSIALGRDPRGKASRAGGLGPAVGDEGSGFWLGRQYLRSAAGERENRKGRASAAEVAALAATVLKKARTDRECARLLAAAQIHLAKLVLDAARPLRFGPLVSVSWAGGLFQDGNFRRGFFKTLSELGSGRRFAVLPPRRRPEEAAAAWGGAFQGTESAFAFLTRK